MPRLTLTVAQISTLLALLHGAQDDDDGRDADYTRNLGETIERLREARRRG